MCRRKISDKGHSRTLPPLSILQHLQLLASFHLEDAHMMQVYLTWIQSAFDINQITVWQHSSTILVSLFVHFLD